ncbi:MAG: hypothetical protein HY862_03650 [Chloroflexi bacterium]|nr:hypothetical protein [Chloroflexota bacterium]
MSNATAIPEAVQALLDLLKEKEEQYRQLNHELAVVLSEHSALRHTFKILLMKLTAESPIDLSDIVAIVRSTLEQAEPR